MQRRSFARAARSNVHCVLMASAGGVFEEAIAMATLLLDPNCEVAETVRNADLIDNTYQVGDALRRPADTLFRVIFLRSQDI